MIKVTHLKGNFPVFKERTALYNKGDIVSCPGCQEQVARLERNIYSGEMLCEGMFKFLQKGHGLNHEFNCKKCGSHLMDHGFFLHLSR